MRIARRVNPVRAAFVLSACAGALGAAALIPRQPPAYQPPPVRTESFEAYLARRLALGAAEGVKPQNTERVVRNAPGRARLAFLYVHGFGASRAEGEAVIDPVAAALAANVYYLRLPGHGGGGEAQAAVRSTDYLDVVDEAVARVQELGEKVVVVGTSTGGLLGTWAAARRPQDVDALVLASPLFGFRDPLAFLAGTPAGLSFIQAVKGPDRDSSWGDDPERRKVAGYEDHWITTQRWSAFGPLHELYRRCYTRETLASVKAPTLLLYDEEDRVVDVSAMKSAFGVLGRVPRSRMVRIEDGNHVLMSRYVRTDKDAVQTALLGFLHDVLPAPAR